MSYPQQPGNWHDPSWQPQQPEGYPGLAQPVSAEPVGKGAYPPPVYPAYGPPVAVPPTNGMAIASMVVSIVGILGLCGYGLGGYIGIVGAILGHVSRKQIRERGENGDGMALAGIVMGWLATAIAVLATIALVVFFVWLAKQDPSTFNNSSFD